jgi:hypothetical protein
MEMIKYNGKLIPFEEYEKIQKKLWDETIVLNEELKREVYKPPRMFIPKNHMLSKEAAMVLSVEIARFLIAKLS